MLHNLFHQTAEVERKGHIVTVKLALYGTFNYADFSLKITTDTWQQYPE